MRSLNGFLTALSLSLALGACADSTGPLAGDNGLGTVPAGTLSAAKKGGTSKTGTTTVPNLMRFASWAPPLETYDTTFVVIQGRADSDTLWFKRDAYGVRMPYMVLNVPKEAQFVDASGQPVPKGATVNLTVHADRDCIQINFGPHGSTFATNPATVQISWFYTDLMGKDPSVLKLWYQPEAGTSWNALSTLLDLKFYWLTSTLDHFSNYAVAY